MFRKVITAAAVTAAVMAGTAGVANAATPAPTKVATCTAADLTNCIGTGTHLGGNLGHGLGFGHGGVLGTGLLGHGGIRGGNFGGRFGGTFWQRGGVILPYDQVVSSCGCSGSDPVSLGYTEVVDPQQVLVVPEGPVVTGDGSCETLTSVNWGLGGFRRGARFFRR